MVFWAAPKFGAALSFSEKRFNFRPLKKRPLETDRGQAGGTSNPAPFWKFGLALIFLLALGIRLAVFFQSQGVPQVETPVLDSRYYLEAGRAVASGEGLGARPFFMSPGYIGFSAFFNYLFGHPQRAIFLFQIVLDSIACILAALLARGLFGSLAGLIAGFFLALNGFQILSTTRILPETAAAFLLAALAFVFLRAEAKLRFGAFFLSGALLGLLALFRSNSLLILPFMGLALWLARNEASFKTVALRFLYCLVGAAVVVLPVTLRNLIVGRDAVLITSSGGVNFYLGNAKEGDGRFISLNQLPLSPGSFDDDPTGNRFERSIQAFAESREQKALRPSQVSGFWMHLALKDISENPLAWFKLLLRKTLLFFNAFEIPQVDNLYFLSRYIPVLKNPLVNVSRILWPLALFGFLVLLFSHQRPSGLLMIFIGYALSVIFFFVTARHRLPAVPIAAGFAGFGVSYLIELLRSWNARRLLGSFGLLIACAAFTNLNPAVGQRSTAVPAQKASWFGVDDEYLDFASQHNNMAALLLERGDAAAAERECRQGLTLKPYHATLLYNLARSLEAQRRLPEAKVAAEQSLRNSPNNAAVAAFLGGLYYQTGDLAGARQALEVALRLSPSNADTWNTLGATLFKLGDTTAAFAALQRAEALAPGWLQPRYNRGIMLNRLGRFSEAAALLDSLQRGGFDNREVELALAEAWAGERRFEEASRLLNGRLAKNPNDVGSLLSLAELHLKQGKPKEARVLILRVLAANPKNSRALELLQACEKIERQGRFRQ